MLNLMKTEHEIELWAERQIDQADRAYMAGKLTDDEYQAETARINAEAEAMYETV